MAASPAWLFERLKITDKVKRVLIVDDSEVIQSRLQALLSEIEQVEIVGMAVNVQQALVRLQSTKPDWVILDLRLPGGGGGMNVLKEIKAKYSATRVAVLTNYPYAAYRKRCFELGADFFFDKSTEFEKVKTIF